MEQNETLLQAKQELEAICTKYAVTLVPVTIHQGNQTFSSIDIVPLSVLAQAQQPAAPAAE
jgi:hypothetical protein